MYLLWPSKWASLLYYLRFDSGKETTNGFLFLGRHRHECGPRKILRASYRSGESRRKEGKDKEFRRRCRDTRGNPGQQKKNTGTRGQSRRCKSTSLRGQFTITGASFVWRETFRRRQTHRGQSLSRGFWIK